MVLNINLPQITKQFTGRYEQSSTKLTALSCHSFMSFSAGAALKRRLFHIWGLEETARGGWLLYFRGETDISYISSLIVLHYNTSCVFYV